MKVEAQRDDGAILVTDGPAALIVLGNKTWITSRDSALAHGEWKPASGAIPAVAAEAADDLAEFRAELEAQKSRTTN